MAQHRRPARLWFEVRVIVTGPGRVNADGSVIDCPGKCTAMVMAGTRLQLQPRPDKRLPPRRLVRRLYRRGRLPADRGRTETVVATFKPPLVWQRDVDLGRDVAVSSDAVYVAGSFRETHDFGGMSATSKGERDIFLRPLRPGREADLAAHRRWHLGGRGHGGHRLGQRPAGGQWAVPRSIDLGGMPLSTSDPEAYFLAWYTAAGQVQRC
jgi:hypothetical protein